MNNNNYVRFSDVNITGGFWKQRQKINAEVTAQTVYNCFSDSHRFEALDCSWREGMENMPHIFWDSDVAKWIEGAAYIIQKSKDVNLEKLCDNAIDKIVENQDSNGYFNSHFLVKNQHQRFKNRDAHELYCAGHLIEAACAYYEATGKGKFLNAMCKYADYIYDIFYLYQTAGFTTCGHPEIELALIRLYELTKREKYLILSEFFLEKRGNNFKDKPPCDFANEYYAQDHKPLKEQDSAEGHSVRALYTYCAMADAARILNDTEYFSACDKIFDNIVNKKMYITGGVGSTSIGEAFGTDYFLPNSDAYTETCAAISLALYCKRMLRLSNNSKYADVLEKAMYNGILSGVSQDGKSFFYENPLEIDPYFSDVNTSTNTKRHVPINQRVELFYCSCCPPNILRFISSLGDTLYTYNDNTLFVHQFMESESNINGVLVRQQTDYPLTGDIKLYFKDSTFKKIAVRMPGWCDNFTVDKEYEMKDGYIYFDNCNEINIKFDMPVKLYEANVYVQNNAGRVCVTRGPVVYCMEEVDNGKHLASIAIFGNGRFIIENNEKFGLPILLTNGIKKKECNSLYTVLNSETEQINIKFIPYYAFANRGECEMLVWTLIK